ncbi:diaminopimelate epimerase [Armatimonas sp.]|uniref:diaminopimelate epimerase n=1 Tax=Armatimonas sp. TaxID=1872638 RepID=UPI003750227E
MTPFTKMQAVGNDFVVLAEPENTDLTALARRVCDRRFGIGADGLLTYKPCDKGLVFRIFNADGSEDTMCGNGLRCVVTLAVERRQVPREGIAQTRSGPIPYSVGSQVTLTLPPPQFWEQSVPGGTTVDTGSLHTVLWPTVLPSDTTFLQDSPALENAPLFPEKTSVLWAVATGPNRLQLRIWERGVGETLGCGTGACAAAAVAIQTGRATRLEPVAVTSRGGTLTITWDGLPGSSLQLTGPAETVFSGTL